MDIGKLLFRTVREDDLPAVCQIAAKVGPGFTSLPNDPYQIQNKITRSLQSFKEEIPREARFFFFVLEDVNKQSVVGTAAIEASVSHFTPYYNYEVATLVQRSEFLQQEKTHTILFMENNYQNTSVLCTLFIDANYRGMKRGEFLSRARCLFISEFPQLFSDTLIAEIRGCFDEKGVAPFWEGLGRHFYEVDFNTANYKTALEGTEIIADLLPSYPIYTCLLPKSATDVIGKAHPNAEAAKHVLEKEGFVYRRYVDILDAGPILEAEKGVLKTVRESRKLKVVACKDKLENAPENLFMISNADMNFRATVGPVQWDRLWDRFSTSATSGPVQKLQELSDLNKETAEVILTNEIAEILAVDVGDWVRIARLD